MHNRPCHIHIMLPYITSNESSFDITFVQQWIPKFFSSRISIFHYNFALRTIIYENAPLHLSYLMVFLKCSVIYLFHNTINIGKFPRKVKNRPRVSI